MTKIYTLTIQPGIHIPSNQESEYLILSENDYKLFLKIIKSMKISEAKL
jgi:hypothetical protein